ncbi:uncharacterized protein K444DRAFT_635557 [Hyaloscypha bicolor E]|uniref:Uncharacterized protein n=1 Tax=Hyaloscypha bicolor E TaxID=1095630 RepID=A0A2J6SRD1_9HELO|nr:uncharacterized protein K444DRAFT_635557 [Hyaloscypha bicolor E]PMD53334.1 hypothetical protein K444DRAFT_635557 [Hyaloscypha bicolor E]
MNISQRDQNAIAYSKHSALLEGDVLVLIRYPNNQPVFDPSGFQLSTTHRVHSANLLATGSAIFKHKLEDEWQNHRAIKRAGLLNNLPSGIKYVIDLTPPEEGDDALALTADLSCSAGVRYWFTAQSRLGVAQSLVAGKDETNVRNGPVSPPTSPTKSNPILLHGDAQVSELSTGATSIINSETTGSQYRGIIPDNGRIAFSAMFDLPANPEHGDEGPTIKKEVSFNKEVTEVTELLDEKMAIQQLGEEILDYCPIRHRAGIERLLQVIEGKDPRLDSAPKVWTLAVLGKYFDCASTVTDYVVRWTVAEPNCRFMEVLPEAALKLGMMLQNHTLTRAGFAVLVSEEALRVGAEKYVEDISIKHKRHKVNNKGLTRFGRACEDLDEDVSNLIQHAGRSFSARIELKLSKLLEKQMEWLGELPEFAKLLTFQQHVDTLVGSTKSASPGFILIDQKRSVDALVSSLRDYVRGRIVYRLLDNLSYQQSKDGTDHRIAERWQHPDQLGGQCFVHDYIYNTLSDHERMVTRGFWEMMRAMAWDTNQPTNELLDQLQSNNAYYSRNLEIAKKYGVEYVRMRHLEDRTREVNTAMRDTTLHSSFHLGQNTAPATSKSAFMAPPTVSEMAERMSQPRQEPDIPNPTLDDWYEAEDRVNSGGSHWTASYWEHEVMAKDTTFGVPRFSLYEFLKEVKGHITSICSTMLGRGEHDWSVLCDTLLCLSDEEYKYLPLWAGGMNDGSGGVFEQEIPPAEKGPIGPGPAFHTGSTANSMASEFEFDGGGSALDSNTMEGIETSLGVEDGFSDHLDRRVVYSEADFPMDHGALALQTRDDGGQASAGAMAAAQPAATVQEPPGQLVEAPSVTSASQIDRDDFFNVQDDEEGDFEMESDSEGTVTED